MKILKDFETVRAAKNFICSSIHSENLKKTIEKASEWVEKYKKFIAEGASSGINEQELMSEKDKIQCTFSINTRNSDFNNE